MLVQPKFADKIQIKGRLYAIAFDREGRLTAQRETPNLVVTSGKVFLVDAWRGAQTIGNMKYHGNGTGTNAAVVGDTALQAESTTILNPASTRATGSLAVGSASNVLRSIGTLVFGGAGSITEWGLFHQSATGGGIMFGRVVFGGIAVDVGASIQYTYEATLG